MFFQFSMRTSMKLVPVCCICLVFRLFISLKSDCIGMMGTFNFIVGRTIWNRLSNIGKCIIEIYLWAHYAFHREYHILLKISKKRNEGWFIATVFELQWFMNSAKVPEVTSPISNSMVLLSLADVEFGKNLNETHFSI